MNANNGADVALSPAQQVAVTSLFVAQWIIQSVSALLTPRVDFESYNSTLRRLRPSLVHFLIGVGTLGGLFAAATWRDFLTPPSSEYWGYKLGTFMLLWSMVLECVTFASISVAAFQLGSVTGRAIKSSIQVLALVGIILVLLAMVMPSPRYLLTTAVAVFRGSMILASLMFLLMSSKYAAFRFPPTTSCYHLLAWLGLELFFLGLSCLSLLCELARVDQVLVLNAIFTMIGLLRAIRRLIRYQRLRADNYQFEQGRCQDRSGGGHVKDKLSLFELHIAT